ncbi:NUDIX hydrolase [Patescibacteria group bacterium]|nr:NUDIX hydrolase [Patescibacteria group bacterium]
MVGPIPRNEAHTSDELPIHLCVACFVLNTKGQIAIGERSRFKGLNPSSLQAFPSGHVDWPDVTASGSPEISINSLRIALLRELGEETNIDRLQDLNPVMLENPCTVSSKGQREIFYIFILELRPAHEQIFVPSAEFRDVFWVNYDDLAQSTNEHPERFRDGFPKILNHAREELLKVTS